MRPHPSVKKVSLETVSEGYDESCYAYVTPANYKEKAAHNDLVRRTIAAQKGTDPAIEAAIEAESNDFQSELVKAHFISGHIKTFEDGQFADADLTDEIAVQVPVISDLLTMFILGYDVDPKAVSKAIRALQISQKSGAPASDESLSLENPQESPSSTP